MRMTYSVRWLSLNKVVNDIYTNWPAFCIELNEDAAKGNPVVKWVFKSCPVLQVHSSDMFSY